MPAAPTARYLDALLRSSEVLAEVAEEADAKGLKLNKQLRNESIEVQRDAIELARRLHGSTADPAEFSGVCLDGGLRVQDRALKLAQTISEDAIEGSKWAWQSIETISQANREVADASLSACSLLASFNPFLAGTARGESPADTSADSATP